MVDRIRRRKLEPRARPPVTSFLDWGDVAGEPVVQICHPDWRGVRTVTYAFRAPVVECADLGVWGEELATLIREASPACVVIQGWPPGADGFARLLAGGGIRVKCVLHSSPAQHGGEPGEAAVADEVLGLAREGVLDGVGMVKAGVAEAFTRLGYPVTHVPNRAPVLPDAEPVDLGPGFHVGVFAEPFWRKNVTTQLLAVALLEGRAHVIRRPPNNYLQGLEMVEHGELPHAEFTALQGSVDLNLYVTLSECHPASPQESYLSGVPCLMSRTSSVFRDDPVLWELTTMAELDNPSAIARAAVTLLDARSEAVERARVWIGRADTEATERWAAFVDA
ncbi:MAG: hypothetical protein WD269_09865 [Acidimicrobiia bacterium]